MYPDCGQRSIVVGDRGEVESGKASYRVAGCVSVDRDNVASRRTAAGEVINHGRAGRHRDGYAVGGKKAQHP
jgi:hypothetical protein